MSPALFIPAVDQLLVVQLPGETIRAPVVKVVDRHTCFVRLDGMPLNPGKSHSYRLHDIVAVRRQIGPLGQSWQAVDDRVLYARAPEVAEPPLPEPKRKRAAKRKAA